MQTLEVHPWDINPEGIMGKCKFVCSDKALNGDFRNVQDRPLGGSRTRSTEHFSSFLNKHVSQHRLSPCSKVVSTTFCPFFFLLNPIKPSNSYSAKSYHISANSSIYTFFSAELVLHKDFIVFCCFFCAENSCLLLLLPQMRLMRTTRALGK